MALTNKKYGWKPDLPDHRDHRFSLFMAPESLTPFVDLRSSCPTPFNQGPLGSCTANAIAGALKFDQTKQKKSTIFTASRLFIYWNERFLEGTVSEDSGAMLRDGIKAVAKWGAPPETVWPYDVNKFATKPSSAAFTVGAQNKALSYQRLNQDIGSFQTCLASGYPFVFGFSVYESFESDAVAASGVVPMPGATEGQLGGHAVMAVGYNAGTTTKNGCPPRHFIVRNSWGPRWGAGGYFYMPFEYLLDNNLADDFWTIKQVQ
jgi:C1A family cysteine protease